MGAVRTICPISKILFEGFQVVGLFVGDGLVCFVFVEADRFEITCNSTS